VSDELRYSPGGISTYIFQVTMKDCYFKFRLKFPPLSVALYNKKPLIFPSINFPISSLAVTV
jgi:hypothetical protein